MSTYYHFEPFLSNTLSNYFYYSGIYLTSIKPNLTPPWSQFKGMAYSNLTHESDKNTLLPLPNSWGQDKGMAETIFEKVGYQFVGYEFVENSSGYQFVGYQKSAHHL